MQPVNVSHYTAVCAAGSGNDELWEAILARRSGLAGNDFPGVTLATHIGRVQGLEASPLPPALAIWDCRNNRLALRALEQDGMAAEVFRIKDRFGPRRIAIVVGTSTASIGNTEDAYRQRENDVEFPPAYRAPVLHSPNSLAEFVQRYFGLEGPCLTVSTACSSSAKVFAAGERLLHLGLADAVLVGGADSLCQSVLQGFNSLQLVSPTPCRPFDIARAGLSLGEGAGFAILTRGVDSQMLLKGHGEASDAHHMSSPHPEGLGARLAMNAALARAGFDAGDVDYVNLHGTATRMNDQIEADAMKAVFRHPVPSSSVKGWMGHTLGAAGIVEAVISLLCLKSGLMPGTLNCEEVEPGFADYLLKANTQAPLRTVMSNSFGFGGNNCSLVFSLA